MKEFGPHPNMKKLYYLYLTLVFLPLFLLGIAAFLLLLRYLDHLLLPLLFSLFYFLPLTVVLAVVLYWIPRYYSSLRYELGEEEVKVKKGVWWRMEHTVPYARIMSVDVIQGPLSRRLGIGTVDIFTAGYTGQRGGGGGPQMRRAEASLLHLFHFKEMRNEILRRVRARPLFGEQRVVEELVRIRELLEKRGRE